MCFVGCLQPLASMKLGLVCKAYTTVQNYTLVVSIVHTLAKFHATMNGCDAVVVSEQAVRMCCHTDGDIYGSEGQYIRYEEGTWDSPEVYEDVSSGHPYANPRGRSGSARPSHSYGGDRFSDDNMANGDAYVTPETTAPLQAAGQVSTISAPSPLPRPMTSPPPPGCPRDNSSSASCRPG